MILLCSEDDRNKKLIGNTSTILTKRLSEVWIIPFLLVLMVYKRLSSSLAEDPVLPGLSHFSLLFEKVLSLAVALAVLLFYILNKLIPQITFFCLLLTDLPEILLACSFCFCASFSAVPSASGDFLSPASWTSPCLLCCCFCSRRSRFSASWASFSFCFNSATSLPIFYTAFLLPFLLFLSCFCCFFCCLLIRRFLFNLYCPSGTVTTRLLVTKRINWIMKSKLSPLTPTTASIVKGRITIIPI